MAKNYVRIYALQLQLAKELRKANPNGGKVKSLRYQIKLLGGKV